MPHAHAAKDTYQHANEGSKDPHGQQGYQQFAGIQALQPSLEPQTVACRPHTARLLKTATRREGLLTGTCTLAAVLRSKFGRLIAAPVFARVGSISTLHSHWISILCGCSQEKLLMCKLLMCITPAYVRQGRFSARQPWCRSHRETFLRSSPDFASKLQV